MGAENRHKQPDEQQKRRADDGPAADGTLSASSGARTRFRRARRRPASGSFRQLTALLKRHGLPTGILLAAGALCYLTSPAAPFLIATLMLAGLCALMVQARAMAGRVDLDAMRSRFEELEDRAWELSESEERYRAITDAFGDLVVIRDHQNNVLACNAAYAESLGLTPEEVVAGNVLPSREDEMPPQEAGPAFPAMLCHPDSSGKRGQSELVIDAPDGRKWFHWLDLPVRDEKAGQSAILSVARDITSFKRSTELDADARKQAEQANRAKSRFLAMASHEMRTPLNGIIGMSKLLGSTTLTAEQQNYTEALERSGQSLLHLIEGMLDLTTIEAGRFVLRPQWFDLGSLLEDTLELLHAQAAEKDIGLGLYVAPQVPARVRSDGERMRQVLINLVGNAIKFTETGGVAVECETAMQEGAETLILRIRDTGPGLSEEDRVRIFGEFERVDDQNTRHAGGAGLGLAISRALAEQFGGLLELEETGPQGSVFTFSFPLEDAEYAHDQTLLEDHDIALVVENPVERTCLARTLQDRGAVIRQPDTDFSGCDTVLVDCDLAPETLEKRRNDPAKQTSRICVLMTAAQKAQWPQLREAGADAWLTRPVRAASLEAVLAGKVEDRPASPKDDQPAEDTPVAGPKRRVLLAEDNDINALLVTAALSKAGHDVMRVHNGAEAIRQSAMRGGEEPGYDLILMDMHMPVMDGVQAIAEIRRQKNTVPILVLSADGVAENRAAALAAGADGCLSKPIDPAELLAIVADITVGEDTGQSEAAS